MTSNDVLAAQVEEQHQAVQPVLAERHASSMRWLLIAADQPCPALPCPALPALLCVNSI